MLGLGLAVVWFTTFEWANTLIASLQGDSQSANNFAVASIEWPSVTYTDEGWAVKVVDKEDEITDFCIDFLAK